MKDLHETAHRIICFGESFWHASGAASGPLGFPVIIAYHLKMLGADPLLITRVGLDEQGKKIIRFIEENRLNTDCFQVDYDFPTGISGFPHYTQGTEAWHSISTDDACFRKIDDASLLVHSTLPLAHEISRESLFWLKEQNTRRLVYVAPEVTGLSREAVQHSLQGAHILYLHIRELELMTGWFASFSTFYDRVSVIQDTFNIPYVFVSLEDGGHFINAQGSIQTVPGHIPGFDPVISMIFLTGVLSQYLANAPIEQAIAFGTKLEQFVSCAGDAFPIYQPGQIPYFKKDY